MVDYHYPEDDRNIGPLVLARRVHKYVMEGGDHNISTQIGTVKIRDNQFGGFQFEIGFHESQAQGTFEFNAGVDSGSQIGMKAGTKTTPIQELAPRIGKVAVLMQKVYDANPWEFGELAAASIGGTGQLTDYEFTYETGTTGGSFSRDAMDNAISSMR
jgi:hypothetical protein